MVNSLNKQQIQAINTLEGPLLILAGAGTGKTATLTARIINLIQSGKAYPENILAVTFTNKAAKEMRDRVQNQLPDTKNLSIGTFHSTAVRILRIYHYAIGLEKNFFILDDSERKKVIKQVALELNIDEKRFPINALSFILSSLKDSNIRAEDEEKIREFKYKDLNLLEFYQTYTRRLKSLNSVDFDDLVLECIYLFKKEPQILNDLQDRFQYIMIDEYQDTNKIQYLWANILASKYRNLCCVGDEDQSIYGWRGAEIKYILNFHKDFPEAKIIKLEQNYRSSNEILEVATALISNNKSRYGKSLYSDSSGQKPNIIICDNDKKEAYDIALKAEKLSADYNYKEMAILVRASYQMRGLEEALITRKVPYKVIDGVRFYDRKEIKDLIAYLRFSYSYNDLLSFERIINVPRRGIGDKTIEDITKHAQSKNINVLEAMKEMSLDGSFSSKVNLNIIEFVNRIERWNEIIYKEISETNRFKIGSIIEMIYNESGYAEMLKNDIIENPEESDRIDNIRELITSVNNFTSIDEMLEHISLISSTDVDDNNNSLSIMTMHAAKGLEFQVVFLPFWDEEIFPSKRSIEENGDSGLEEERRLAYVAITRAKQELFIYSCKTRFIFGKVTSCVKSRFVNEIKDLCNIKDYTNNQRIFIEQNKNFSQNNQQIYSNKYNSNHSSSYQNKTIKQEYSKNTLDSGNGSSLNIGDVVMHEKFGKGIVKKEIGQQFLEVSFEDNMTRIIKSSFLKIIK